MFVFKVEKATEGYCGICRREKAVVTVSDGTEYGGNSNMVVHKYCKHCAAMLSNALNNYLVWEEETEKRWE